ncbi:recombination protein O N-terminal domain-containing protein [Hymenobacter sp. BRD67]|nr:recombination protein O N-terminal domain-containing protein [Hymenobacter sp. BRD67]
MLIKTRGIVLSYLKYRESSIIARVYTEQRGCRATS